MSKKEDISPPDFAVATKAEAEETEPLVPVAVASPAKVQPKQQREITSTCVTSSSILGFKSVANKHD